MNKPEQICLDTKHKMSITIFKSILFSTGKFGTFENQTVLT